MDKEFNDTVDELRRVEKLLHVHRELIMDEFWKHLISTPDRIPKVLTLLRNAARVYSRLDDDSQAIVLCAAQNAVYYINIKGQSNYRSMALEIAILLIGQKEITLAHELLLSSMPFDDRKKLVGAIEKASLEEEALSHILYYTWDGKLTACNCYIWLRVCAMFTNSTTLFADEIRSAMRIFEEQEIGNILEDPVLADLFRRLPPFLLTADE